MGRYYPRVTDDSGEQTHVIKGLGITLAVMQWGLFHNH